MPFESSLDDILKRDRRYSVESYRFVNAVLCYEVRRLEREIAAMPKEFADQEPPQVSAADLCRAVCSRALESYGFLARTVLSELGIKKTDDVGRIVFNLNETGQIKVNDDDRIEDFFNVFDLGEELDRGFHFRK